ncbi:hypothetical protein G6L37_22415 [Agrobacterium rubi]|uniref:hypothetical protein n=1 Tax=Agrobacterium rubi TaxID=28099 RepID=UPI001572B548|nr:hypothetical protein [Agrobacterium rubi]NTF08888.1 hypothetical protein [Agrobacterium rubi]NTF21159.1 hypothetical protein [Agrobacterium rubi]NTF28016.1 hypothetical protein [Agrobacterium rubi]
MQSEKHSNLADSILVIGETVNRLFKEFDTWLKKPEVQAAFSRVAELPDAINHRLQEQRKFLRRGILPSDPIYALSGEQYPLTASLVARGYGTALERKEHFDEAQMFGEIAQLAELGNAKHTLRVIYPEIEAVARRYMYESGVTDGITSLVEMRVAIGELQAASLGTAASLLSAETFTFVNLFAIDFAYKTSYENGTRGRRVFAKVANRHEVCHGISSNFEDVHVINALTLLYIAVVVGHFMVQQGTRLPKQDGKIRETLRLQRIEQREVNREMLSLIRSLQSGSAIKGETQTRVTTDKREEQGR